MIAASPGAVSAYVQVLGEKDASGQVKREGKPFDVNVGSVESSKPDKLEITNRGKKIEVHTEKNLKIIETPSGKRIAPGQIKKDDRVATFGAPNDASKSAHLILVKPKHATDSAKPETRRRAVYGLVREIKGNILVISHPLKDDPRYKVAVVDSTLIKKKGVANPTIADIKVGDRVSAVGNWTADLLMAKKVHVIPGHAFGLLQKVATGSASPTATPSATPTATASATP